MSNTRERDGDITFRCQDALAIQKPRAKFRNFTFPEMTQHHSSLPTTLEVSIHKDACNTSSVLILAALYQPLLRSGKVT